MLVYFFQAGIGSWNMSIFEGKDEDGNLMMMLYRVGELYQIIFILVNLVLLFNFVIAILSSTFAKYEEIQDGLYNNVVNELFPVMQWDDEYGALICSKPPFNLLTFPFYPIFFLIKDPEKRV